MKVWRVKNQRGLTLVELMLVVGIFIILASIAIPVYTNQIRRQRMNEAYATISLIRSAEEAYFQVNGCYLPMAANPANGGNPPAGARPMNWDNVAPWNSAGLNILNNVDGQTRFQYTVQASSGGTCGGANAAPAGVSCVANFNNYNLAAGRWYVISAVADLDKAGGNNTTIISAKSRQGFTICNELQ